MYRELWDRMSQIYISVPVLNKKIAFLSQKNDLLSRLVINGGVFCPGTEPRKNGTERVGQNVAYSVVQAIVTIIQDYRCFELLAYAVILKRYG